ncbi:MULTISPECIES: YlmC/YmxH family sporulation protein [Paenisporosarcina]|jgi:YlmC/YmxH family sporulation protein|uniref:YlmC/YmxH family sporulation protein n=1 Tax=Paenisporosarcina quisquiliarum TaxID=365346 RepID=A0A9X3LFZ8_9BACL|nr:YlmC/YmxH family sporulation protein [Paenisporosarcina quisquiliarum]MCZ8535659.1 YlmC/YmxH family sporulation protein [Paenisporosarcina quisquiliarum]
MLLSELAVKELIQVEDGKRFGILADTELLFEPTSGKIIGFLILKEQGSRPFKSKSTHQNVYIAWEDIVLIGEHRILFTKTSHLHAEQTI